MLNQARVINVIIKLNPLLEEAVSISKTMTFHLIKRPNGGCKTNPRTPDIYLR